ncbi:MAG: hypothetical protein ACTSU5_20315 [Promethearchaeota archaeon]
MASEDEQLREKIFGKTYETMGEAEKNRDLYDNWFVAENARKAIEAGNVDEARKLLQRSFEICEKWGVAEGANWAREQLGKL